MRVLPSPDGPKKSVACWAVGTRSTPSSTWREVTMLMVLCMKRQLSASAGTKSIANRAGLMSRYWRREPWEIPGTPLAISPYTEAELIDPRVESDGKAHDDAFDPAGFASDAAFDADGGAAAAEAEDAFDIAPKPPLERRQSGSMRVEELDIWGDDGAQMTKEEIRRRPSMRPLRPGEEEEDEEGEVQLELPRDLQNHRFKHSCWLELPPKTGGNQRLM